MTDGLLQEVYWKKVEEFDKVKIYSRYFKHNNAQQSNDDNNLIADKINNRINTTFNSQNMQTNEEVENDKRLQNYNSPQYFGKFG